MSCDLDVGQNRLSDARVGRGHISSWRLHGVGKISARIPRHSRQIAADVCGVAELDQVIATMGALPFATSSEEVLSVTARGPKGRLHSTRLGNGRSFLRCTRGHSGLVARQVEGVVMHVSADDTQGVGTCLHATKSALLSDILDPVSAGILPSGPCGPRKKHARCSRHESYDQSFTTSFMSEDTDVVISLNARSLLEERTRFHVGWHYFAGDQGDPRRAR